MATGDALVEGDDDFVRQRRVGGVIGVVVDILGGGIPQVFEEAGFDGAAPHVLVNREGVVLRRFDRQVVLLGVLDGNVAGQGKVAQPGEMQSMSGAIEVMETSKRTWSLPLPVQPWATVVAPKSRAP